MLPTRLTVFLFLLSLLFLPAGAFYPPTVWAVLSYDGCLFLLLFADALLGKAASARLRARRQRPARLSIGTDNPVVLVLENPTGRPVRVVARDEPPPGFAVEPALLQAAVPPHTSARLSYRLLPANRGNFTF